MSSTSGRRRVRDYVADAVLVPSLKLSAIGERRGSDRLIYNPGVFVFFHLVARKNAPGFAAALRACFPDARRLVDVGAGTGMFARATGRLGPDVVALERSPYGRALARAHGVDARPFDLLREPPAAVEPPYDVAYCLEVAEHLPPELGDRLVAYIAGLAPAVVFSAAQPGQGGQGHVNEQPPGYWTERFAAHGFDVDDDATGEIARGLSADPEITDWLSANVRVLRRRS